MAFSITSLFENELADLVTINLIIWGALIVAVSIILWETMYLAQAVPVMALAAVMSNFLLLWGIQKKRTESGMHA